MTGTVERNLQHVSPFPIPNVYYPVYTDTEVLLGFLTVFYTDKVFNKSDLMGHEVIL